MRDTKLHSCAGLLVAIVLTSGLVACGSDAGSSPTAGDASTTNSAPKTGTFTVDGQQRSCKVETQFFPATNEFSVVCQDDAYGLVQVTFKDEASARLDQSLTVIKGSVSSHPDPKTVVVEMQPLPGGPQGPVTASTDGAQGTASSAGSTVKLEGVVLTDVGGTVKRTVSALIPY